MTVTRKTSKELIDRDIRRAETLPAEYYRDGKYFELAKDRIFAKSWQFIADGENVKDPGQILPCTALEGYLDEPLLLTRDSDNRLHCLSNVCTHRGNLLAEDKCNAANLRCRYHGRRFALDGHYLSAPGFEEAECFPSEKDNLTSVAVEAWGRFIFASIDPAYAVEDLLEDMKQRLSWLEMDRMKLDAVRSRDYHINANWALYVENYLEGLHVPYVHPGLATAIDTKDYRHELHKYSNLQIGIATDSADAFELPPESPDAGEKIAAYYYWLFPNIMFNFYPWGLSMNIVIPQAVDQTKIRYYTYVVDESKLKSCSPELIEQTEREDQAIVQQVQKGMKSRLYKRGRYAPEWEQNVHHFHRLLVNALADQ